MWCVCDGVKERLQVCFCVCGDLGERKGVWPPIPCKGCGLQASLNMLLPFLSPLQHKMVANMFLNQEAAVAKVAKAAAMKNKRKGQGMISKPTVGLQVGGVRN